MTSVNNLRRWLRDPMWRAVCLNPECDTTRLAFADYVEERGDEPLATRIRAAVTGQEYEIRRGEFEPLGFTYAATYKRGCPNNVALPWNVLFDDNGTPSGKLQRFVCLWPIEVIVPDRMPYAPTLWHSKYIWVFPFLRRRHFASSADANALLYEAIPKAAREYARVYYANLPAAG